MEKYRFWAEPVGAAVIEDISPENKKAVEDICGILNGKTLEDVETIINNIRQAYPQSTFHRI